MSEPGPNKTGQISQGMYLIIYFNVQMIGQLIIQSVNKNLIDKSNNNKNVLCK